MGILGNYQISPDKFRERGYSAYGEYLLDTHTALGVSSLITHAAADRFTSQPLTRQAHGVTARAFTSPVRAVRGPAAPDQTWIEAAQLRQPLLHFRERARSERAFDQRFDMQPRRHRECSQVIHLAALTWRDEIRQR